MAINIENTHDGYADITATEDEWTGLISIVAFAASNYDDCELYLDMPPDDIAELHREVSRHDDLPAPLEKRHVGLLLAAISRTGNEHVPGLSHEEHAALVQQMSAFNMLDLFHPDPEAVRAIGRNPGSK